MKIGLCLPYMKHGISRQTIIDWCRLADQGPFSSLSCGERITGYTYEMRVLLSMAAALTERIRIVPSLYVLPMHSAVLTAKEIATLDVMSNGRVTVTVGVGGREHDYRAVGASFEHRHERMDQQIAEMKRIWAGEPPFPGADEVGPRPFQAGGPPILVGAMGPKAIARASHWADGIYGFSMAADRKETRKMFDLAEQAWAASSRTTKPLLVGGFWYSLADGAQEKLRQYVYDYLEILDKNFAKALADSMTNHNEAAILASLDEMQAAGCEEVFMVPATADISELERLANLLAKRA